MPVASPYGSSECTSEMHRRKLHADLSEYFKQRLKSSAHGNLSSRRFAGVDKKTCCHMMSRSAIARSEALSG
jgi:hypothetical protein